MDSSGIIGGGHISWCDGFIDSIDKTGDTLEIRAEFMLRESHPEYRAQPDGFWACYRKGILVAVGVTDLQILRWFPKNKGRPRKVENYLPFVWPEERSPSIFDAQFCDGAFTLDFDTERVVCSARNAFVVLDDLIE